MAKDDTNTDDLNIDDKWSDNGNDNEPIPRKKRDIDTKEKIHNTLDDNNYKNKEQKSEIAVQNSGQIPEMSIQEIVHDNMLDIKSNGNMQKSERLEKEESSITKSDIKSVIF